MLKDRICVVPFFSSKRDQLMHKKELSIAVWTVTITQRGNNVKMFNFLMMANLGGGGGSF
jgi:hypothetical protein